ncbi:hypothetical protein LCGC14_1937650 [marine sediment metagenome]|uniref:Uncharacterized protein n=1 Tax=marine sediment metagenome TaxID=412755 RepID=A0A0F9FLI8_9ZZZZ
MNNIINNTLDEGAFWRVNKAIAAKVGIEAAVLLADIISRRNYFNKRGMLDKGYGFFLDSKFVADTVYIKKDKRIRLTKVLIAAQYIRTVKKGLPQRIFYYVNDENVLEQIASFVGNPDGVHRESRQQSSGKPTVLVGKADDINKNKKKNKPNKNDLDYKKPIELYNKLFNRKSRITETRKTEIKTYCNVYSVDDLCIVIEQFSKVKWKDEKKYNEEGPRDWLHYLMMPSKRDSLHDQMLAKSEEPKKKEIPLTYVDHEENRRLAKAMGL